MAKSKQSSGSVSSAKVKDGDKVKIDYTGTLEDGTVFDSSIHGDHSHPLEFTVGAGQVIKGFNDAIIGMKVGEEKDITLQPSEAYGDHNPQLVREFPRNRLPEGQEPKKGMILGIGLANGQQVPATIVDVTKDTIKLDLNPPLVGKVLNFKIKLVGIEG